jgi:hypothetical protein
LPTEIASPSSRQCNWPKRFTRVFAIPIGIECDSGWNLALETYSIRSELGFHVFLFFRGLDTFGDQFVGVCFPCNNIGFWGQSWPKFQNLNVDNNINDISGFGWVLVPLISSTSSIFWRQWVHAKNALLELWWCI